MVWKEAIEAVSKMVQIEEVALNGDDKPTPIESGVASLEATRKPELDQSAISAATKIRPARGIPTGNYRLVGWSIDTTGRRLIDEIWQIAAYTPDNQFAQMVMPFTDLNSSFRRRHNMVVVNKGRYRTLLDLRSRKFMKTKSLMAALGDFLIWLEKVRGTTSDGVILVYHEMRKASPGILLEVMRQYSLLERFQSIVKGFANGAGVALARCPKSIKSYSLWSMAKHVVHVQDESVTLEGAVERCKMTYEVAVALATSAAAAAASDDDLVANKAAGLDIMDLVCAHTHPIQAELDEIAQFKVLLERQNTFRPVFGALLRGSRIERQQASRLRRILAENNINFDKVKDAFQGNAKNGIATMLKDDVPNVKDADYDALLNILDCYFDPDKIAIMPKPRFYPGQDMNNDQQQENNNNNNGGVRKPNRRLNRRNVTNGRSITNENGKTPAAATSSPNTSLTSSNNNSNSQSPTEGSSANTSSEINSMIKADENAIAATVVAPPLVPSIEVTAAV